YFFFFNTPPTTVIYTLSLHDALPISTTWSRTTAPPTSGCSRPATARRRSASRRTRRATAALSGRLRAGRSLSSASERGTTNRRRSEEHTSELQSLAYLVCRLLLEKKK